jgi:hypothetical protein
MKIIKQSEITNKELVCVFCLNPKNNKFTCCKEIQFEFGYTIQTDDELYLESEVTLKKDN